MQKGIDTERYILNPIVFDKRKKYIWFDRSKIFREGILESFKIFLYYELYLDGFATSNLADVGLKIFNKKVVNINELNEDSAIVFMNIEYEDIKYSICKPLKINYVENETQKANNLVQLPKRIDGFRLKKDIFIRVYRIVEMLTMTRNKKIFIYGNSEEAIRFSRYLRLLDFEFYGFYCDYEELCEEAIDGYSVYCIEEFLYENNGFVIVENKMPEKSLTKLENMGYKYGIDFVFAEPFASHFLFVRKNALDINLGNTFVGASKYSGVQIRKRNILNEYPGFCVYGEETGKKYKVVVLGGSTTDGNMFPFKSWSELLYEKIKSNNVIIYNGGVSGYTSGQELLKFIRDVLPMKPDMVLDLSGYNDTCQVCSDHPYSFSYAKEIYDYGSRNMADEYVAQQIGTDLCEGINIKQTRFMNWQNNMELMYTIAASKGIRFYAFLQPMLKSKKRSRNEEEIFLSSRQFYEKELFDEASFRDEIKKETNKECYKYIYDLSDIFDDVSDVYMDICHVYEKGNDIIAGSIYNIIKNELYI